MRQVVNKVTIEGYLRENNLERVRDKTGEEVIRGSLLQSTMFAVAVFSST